jgi:PKD repeat protein
MIIKIIRVLIFTLLSITAFAAIANGATNVKPRAIVRVTPTVAPFNKPVTFNAASSTDVDGMIVDYDWQFSNGLTAKGAIASTTFTKIGQNFAILTLTDNTGATTTLKRYVSMRPNVKPKGVINVTPTPQIINRSVWFDAASSTDADGAIISYSWDLGDGFTATGVTANTTYASTGPKNISLTVTDDNGATTTIRKVVNVQPRPFGPPEGAKIFLLMGQSNMAGAGSASIADQIADKTFRNNIWVQRGTTWMNPMRDPIHSGNTTGTGPGSFFADAYVKNHFIPGQATPTIVLIPCALGATPMSDWKPGGYLYDRCVARADQVLATVENSKVSGVLYYQGESNTSTELRYSTWVPDFTLMVQGIQSKYPGTPVVFAQLATASGAYMSPTRFWNQLKDAMAAVSLPNVKMIKTDDIPDHLGGDGVHLKTPAYKVVGERFEEALRSMEI